MPYFPPDSGGGGGSMAIGSPVAGAISGGLLFTDASLLLEQDAPLTWNDAANQLNVSPGAAATPSLIFGDAGTGIFRSAFNALGFSTAGVSRAQFSAAGNFIASTDNAIDIGGGSGANRFKNLHLSNTCHAAVAYRIGTDISSSWLLSISSSIARMLVTGPGAVGFGFTNGTAPTSGAFRFFDLVPGSGTGQTAGTEINGFSWATFTRQWATGAIANQREFAIQAPTYGFVGASVITNAATLFVSGAPIAGANATITNGFAAWFGAKLRIDAAIALGGGGAATLGTIGGTGPATTTQNEWIEVHTQNGKRFVPAWA